MAVKKGKVEAKKPKRAKPAVAFAPLKFKDFTITQKNSGRYAVVGTNGKNINGSDKVKVLTDAKVLKGSFKKEAAEATAN